MSLIDRVREALLGALGRAAREKGFDAAVLAGAGEAAWTVERPKRPEHGDLATNIALVLQKQLKSPPRALAQGVVDALAGDPVISSAEIAGPGFINLRLHPRAFHAELDAVLRAGASGFGRAPAATRERINLEFVSANPTGPINVASGRNAIYGDTVARLLEATGHRVTREYYINDRGNQIRKFAESVRAISEGREVPEDGYQGEYVKELAAHIAQNDKESLAGDVDTLGRTCVTWMLRGIPGSKMLPGISRSLASLGIYFDVWFSEESLYRWGAVPMALAQLANDGYLVRKDGALFFVAKSSDEDKEGEERMTADEDRVVQKSNGEYAYFASDIAYAKDKLDRGYDRIMIVLGADHHGYVTRMRNALEAQGLPSERFEALLYQLVFVYRNGALFQSSKRAGNFVTIEEVADEIDDAAGRKGAGSDAIRFFFLSRHANSNVAFDVDLAKKKSLDNPIFYVQYGYARLCSILRKAESIGIVRPELPAPETWAKLVHPDELAIAARLSEFPELVRGAAETREPHKIVFFVQELARDFQSYFTRMKTDPILPQASQRAEAGWESRWDHDKTAARLAWVEAMRITYKAALDLLGVGAPERMDKPASGEDAAEDQEG